MTLTSIAIILPLLLQVPSHSEGISCRSYPPVSGGITPICSPAGGGASSLLTGLISYWKLDEASGTRNDSAGTNHLTDNNTVASGAGQIGNASNFVIADTDWLSRVSNAGLQFAAGDSFTVATWVKRAGVGAYHDIFGKGSSGAPASYEFRGFISNANDVRVGLSDGSADTVHFTGSINDTNWHFLIWSYDAATSLAGIQIDNAAISTSNVGARGNATAGDFRIGANVQDPGAMDGLIDEFGLWDRVLTVDERTGLWNGGAGKTYPFN